MVISKRDTVGPSHKLFGNSASGNVWKDLPDLVTSFSAANVRSSARGPMRSTNNRQGLLTYFDVSDI